MVKNKFIGSNRSSGNVPFYLLFSFLPMLVIWSYFQFIELFSDNFESLEHASLTSLENDLFKDKLKGVHYFGRFHDSEINFENVCASNVEDLVLVPYGYQDSYDKPELNFRGRGRRSVESRDSMYFLLSREAGKKGLNIILKPHIWMRTDGGKWRSDIKFDNSEQFELWACNYSEFIMHYARVSEQIGATHFCIGTELAGLTEGHDEFWLQLIEDVRSVFSGKLFYAANWYKEYEHIKFWSALDYIGIQAYFPICRKPSPSISDLKNGWKTHRVKLKKISQQFQRPILFSELGYRSSTDAAVDPWSWVDGKSANKMIISEQTQANCYEAFFQTFWDQPWFAGAFIWQWHSRYESDQPEGAHSKLDFTPQNKAAQSVMANWFAR